MSVNFSTQSTFHYMIICKNHTYVKMQTFVRFLPNSFKASMVQVNCRQRSRSRKYGRNTHLGRNNHPLSRAFKAAGMFGFFFSLGVIISWYRNRLKFIFADNAFCLCLPFPQRILFTLRLTHLQIFPKHPPASVNIDKTLFYESGSVFATWLSVGKYLPLNSSTLP